MKKIEVLFVVLAFTAVMSGQNVKKTLFKYNDSGELKSVIFSPTDSGDVPKTPDDFFSNILKIRKTDNFIKNSSAKLEKRHEAYDQYYGAIRVKGAGYVFHYDEDGNMVYAHGNYLPVHSIQPVPTISSEESVEILLKHMGIDHISAKDITTELIIKPYYINGKKTKQPVLVYEVELLPLGVLGYIDANSRKVLGIESTACYSASTGLFETIYNNNVYGSTSMNAANRFHLYDNSRGIVIHTMDLNGHRSDSISSESNEIEDNDNSWYQNERINNTGIALDVHWALQKFYDRLYHTHGKNSLDNNGKDIIAYTDARIKIYTSSGWYVTRDNAAWVNGGYFLFGAGSSHNPYTELDIVAHEYGHGITHYQIDWGNDQRYLNEGLSDIWGAIMEYRFGPVGSSVWKMGDQLHANTPNHCTRNLAYPDSTGNASAYQSTLYNSGSNYVKSGVFSHWFYLLVEGGSGTNENGHTYSVSGVGMDIAEQLIVKAVYEGYLRYTTSFSDVRESFILAAQSMNNSNLVRQVKNAWNAVDVWADEFAIEGPYVINTQSVYSVDDAPDAYNISWSLSNSYYNTNCLQQNTPSSNKCTITRSSSQDMSNATLTAIVSYNGTVLANLTKSVYAHSGFKGTYYNGQTTKQVNLPYPLYVRPSANVIITSPNLMGATVSYSGSFTPSVWSFNSNNGNLTVGMAASNNSTLVVNVTCDNGSNYYLPIIVTTNTNVLSVNLEEGRMEISVIPVIKNTENQREKELYPYKEVSPSWTVKVINATTGEYVIQKEVEGDIYSIDTFGWKAGIYIIYVTIGDEVLSEKVMIK